MAISQIGTATVAKTTAGTSVAPEKPTGTAQYDLMVAHVFIENVNALINNVPSGWEAIVNYCPSPRAIRQYVYWKVAGASENGSYTWGTSSTTEIIAQIVTLRGINTSDPIGNQATSTSTASGSAVAPSINIQTIGNWALSLVGSAYGTTWTASASPAFTELIDTMSGASANSGNISAQISRREYTATGETGNITSVPANADYFVASLIEIKIYVEGQEFTRNLDETIGFAEAPVKGLTKAMAAGILFREYATLPFGGGVLGDIALLNSPYSIGGLNTLVTQTFPHGFTDWEQFKDGEYEFRKALVKLIMEDTFVNSQEDSKIIEHAVFSDVIDVIEIGTANITGAVKRVTFQKKFHVVPVVTVTGSNLSVFAIPDIVEVTKTYFDIRLKIASGGTTTGTVTWSAHGY